MAGFHQGRQTAKTVGGDHSDGFMEVVAFVVRKKIRFLREPDVAVLGEIEQQLLPVNGDLLLVEGLELPGHPIIVRPEIDLVITLEPDPELIVVFMDQGGLLRHDRLDQLINLVLVLLPDLRVQPKDLFVLHRQGQPGIIKDSHRINHD